MRISDWSSDVCSSDLIAFTTTVSGQTVARLPAILVVRDSSNNTKVTVDNTGAMNIWGGTLSLGTSSQAGAFSISDGSSNTVTLQSSEERRVGKECVSKVRSRWSQYH